MTASKQKKSDSVSEDNAGSDVVEIITDGACKGNPGPGGWAVLLRFRGVEKTLSGGDRQTTNNRMEMLAVIRGLEALKRPCKVLITTDSQYVMKGITEWMASWKKRGWKTQTGTPVKNVELWRRIDELASAHDVQWRWVRGHNGHKDNERVDSLARQAIKHLGN